MTLDVASCVVASPNHDDGSAIRGFVKLMVASIRDVTPWSDSRGGKAWNSSQGVWGYLTYAAGKPARAPLGMPPS